MKREDYDEIAQAIRWAYKEDRADELVDVIDTLKGIEKRATERQGTETAVHVPEANYSCFECAKLTRCPSPARGMPDDGSTPPCFEYKPEPVQSAPSEEDAIRHIRDYVEPLEALAKAQCRDPHTWGKQRYEEALESISALRAQLAESSKLQGYLDEECRLRREAETRAEAAEAQLAERTRDDESVEKILQHLKAELDRKDTVIKLVRERLDFARAALDGKETPHA